MIGIIILVLLALIMGVIIVIVDNNLSKAKGNKEDDILKLLPNINCGGCGYVNCSNMALEIIKNKEVIYKCRPLKNKEETLRSIDRILK